MAAFPSEILKMIFSHLDYCALKTCTRVNKNWQKITEDRIFDSEMFRSKQFYSTVIRLHPALRKLSLVCGDTHEKGEFYLHGKEDEYITVPWLTTSAPNEMATVPPLDSITVRFGDYGNAEEVQNNQGVTVLQVVKALCDCLGSARSVDPRWYEGFDQISVGTRGGGVVLSVHHLGT